MNSYSLFAGFLKDERKRLGLNQAQVASLCGVSREIWGRYERGASVPGGEVLAAFVKAGADAKYIFTGEPNASTSPHLSPDEQMLLESYRALSVAQRKVLLAELLTGTKVAVKPKRSSTGVSVEGNNNRVAGGDYTEK